MVCLQSGKTPPPKMFLNMCVTCAGTRQPGGRTSFSFFSKLSLGIPQVALFLPDLLINNLGRQDERIPECLLNSEHQASCSRVAVSLALARQGGPACRASGRSLGRGPVTPRSQRLELHTKSGPSSVFPQRRHKQIHARLVRSKVSKKEAEEEMSTQVRYVQASCIHTRHLTDVKIADV